MCRRERRTSCRTGHFAGGGDFRDASSWGAVLDAWMNGDPELRALSPSSLAALVYSSMRNRAP